ncbi:MAG TPA: hypothetical protein VHX11_08985 [Acidobacteriaceae bacterium]|jgi:hypothetical protein|nr:hypothetical protein [Acidobacteriaceae bacterium]
MRDPEFNGLDPIALAKKLGTYNQIDRSKQYEGRYSNELLLKSSNELWAKIRTLEQKVCRYEIMRWVLTAAVTGEGAVIGWLASELIARLH